MRNLIILLASVLALALAVACADTRLPTPTPNIQATIAAWQESVATATPVPTPTVTPRPKPTVTPNPTPAPTEKWGLPYIPIPISNIPPSRKWGRLGKEPFILQACYARDARITYGHFSGGRFLDLPGRTRTRFTFTEDGQFDDDSLKAVVTGFHPTNLSASACYNLAVRFSSVQSFCGVKGRVSVGPCYHMSVYRLIGYQTYEKVR